MKERKRIQAFRGHLKNALEKHNDTVQDFL